MKPSPSAINERLSNLHSLGDVRQFVAQLGFSYRDELLPTKTLPAELSAALAQPPRIIGAAQNFLVGFVQLKATDAKDLDRYMIRWQRQMISKLPDTYQDASLLIFASDGFTRVHFVNAKRVGKRLILRRFLTGGEHKTRTAAERLQHLYLDGSEDYQRVLKLADEAFDRDAVTEKFFKSFETVFKSGKRELVAQIKDEHAAHQFLHSLLNRLMFIYFVQRKGWLADGDAEFIKTLWDMYREERDSKRVEPDTFYRDWLATLFFSAFNNKHGYEHKGLPQPVVNWFKLAPYLDGGLFMESPYDGMGFAVPDAMFEHIFEDILNAYNFTVTEDTPFDQNIAVDPEMLGIVYESLVNTTELSDEKAGAGIFYTPRVEVDFMCRRALVEHLARRSSAKREDLYRFVFPEDGEERNPKFERKLQDELDDALVNMTVVDPACGSGAFLVGMMQVIVELRKLLWEMGGKKLDSFDDFDHRKRTIERSLYGVDVKDWAISIAQLRLWLTLIEVADEKKLDLRAMKVANDPLLPKLGFRLRVGDSLVQEIAGTTIPLRSAKGKLSPAIQRRVTELRGLKTDYYFNRGNLQEKHIKDKELEVYGAILDEKRKAIREEIGKLEQSGKVAFQQDLLSHLGGQEVAEEAFSEHKEKQEERRKVALKALHDELRKLDSIHNNLPKKQRLFWSIEFAEVFQESGGFDIVIGNPPYVRQEKIADPFTLVPGKDPDVEANRAYKEKLAKMIDDDWGSIVRGKQVAGASIGKRSDLYVYFYLRGLALTREGGVFIFITSNSWLDVGYGAGLQEFLLKRARVLAIYDNEAKRSFKSAEVNTIIALLEPLPMKALPDGEHLARLVMFKEPFEEAASSDTLCALEEADQRQVIHRKDDSLALARIVPMTQRELYLSGTEPDETDDLKQLRTASPYDRKFIGDKWGGKYLRAPDIYWTLLDKCGSNLVELGAVASVKFGVKTGNNEFFFLETVESETSDGCLKVKNGLGWEGWIETEYLQPAIQRVEECPSLLFTPRKYLFICEGDPSKRAEELIAHGESVGANRTATCAARSPWWRLKVGSHSGYELGFNYNIHDTGWTYRSLIEGALYSNVFHVLKAPDLNALQAYMDSSVFHLFVNVLCRTSLGGGKAKLERFELERLPAPAELRSISSAPEFKSVFAKLSKEKRLSLTAEDGAERLRQLDEIVCEALGLSGEYGDQIRSELKALIDQRLGKAKNK